MIIRLLSTIKCIMYKLKYGQKLILHGLPIFHKNVQIKIKRGKLFIGRDTIIKNGSYIAVVNNGNFDIKGQSYLGRNCIMICHNTISIGKDVHIGPNVMLFDHDHKFDNGGIKEGFTTAPITIEDHCWISAGVIILKGTTIGKGTIIGAGAIVKGTIPPYSLVTSNRDLQIRSL